MASATKLPIKSLAFTTALVLSLGASKVNVAAILRNTFTGPGNYKRIAAIAIVLANLKNVPFAWHFRVFNAILKHCLFSIPRIPKDQGHGASSLFLPVITTSHAPFWECDYNFHKSNSTYFSDLDVTRSHLICCLLQPGIDKLHHNARHKLVLDAQGKAVRGAWGIMLGGVMCSFKREIGIFESYEMWTRMLCWDRKWMYVVTHFVKKGTVRPKGYVLGDGSWLGSKGYVKAEGEGEESADQEIDEKAIFASAISKYVVKLGRLTIHPEVLLQAANMLPPRPGGWTNMDGSTAAEEMGESTPELVQNEEAQTGDEWNWERVEEENRRGLSLAEQFGALDGLHREFSGSREPALGRYRDFLL